MEQIREFEFDEVFDPGDAGFADRINPSRFSFGPRLTAVVGAIIGHDYGIQNGAWGYLSNLTITSDGYVTADSTTIGKGAAIGVTHNVARNLSEYLDYLNDKERAEFDRLYALNVHCDSHYRSCGNAMFRGNTKPNGRN